MSALPNLPANAARPSPRRALLRRIAPPRMRVFYAMLAIFVLVAVFAPWIAPQDPDRQNLIGRLKPPGTTLRGVTYWLGSDELGRDLLSRVIFGARVSLMVAVLSVLGSGILGTALGMIAGYFRGPVGVVIMRLVDIVMSVPAILLAIITVAILGPGLVNVVAVLAFTRWPRYARVAYGQTLGLMSLPYIRLSRTMGASAPRVLWRHVLPNIVGPIMVVVTLEVGLMVLFEAGLSFLGLGVQPPTASWGAILATGRNYMTTAWWIAIFPGLCLFLLVLSVNVLGDHVRDTVERRR